MATKQERIVGVNAVRAVIAHRPDSITRVYLREDLVPVFGEFLRERARQHHEYHVVDDASLERLSESTHHEGVCFFAAPRRTRTVEDLAKATGARTAVLLEGVKNPHNLGAIMRVAAHFGVDAIVVQRGDIALSSAALRTAEGGGEAVQLVIADSLPRALDTLKNAKFFALATSSHENGAVSLFDTTVPTRAVWMFGSETNGLSRDLMSRAQQLVMIAGTGEVESLNVATAAAVCLSWGYAQAKTSK